jgi:hypothetical protein
MNQINHVLKRRRRIQVTPMVQAGVAHTNGSECPNNEGRGESSSGPRDSDGNGDDVCVFVRKCVDVVVELCRIYGFDDVGYSRKSTYDHWILQANAMGEGPIKYVKWKISSFYAFWAGQIYGEYQDLPSQSGTITQGSAKEHPGVLLCGRGYRWVNYLHRKDEYMFQSFVTSVLRCKSGMPRANSKLLAASAAATVESLTSVPRTEIAVSVPTAKGFREVDIQRLQRELDRTVRECFHGSIFSMEERLKAFVPSSSANYCNGRANMGAIGSIIHDAEIMRGLRTTEPLVKIDTTRGKSGMYVCDKSLLVSRFNVMMGRVVSKAYREPPLAKPVALPEALKVRVITKGPPFTYTALKPLQSFMWKKLRGQPTFRLIGEPVKEEILDEVLGALSEPCTVAECSDTPATQRRSHEDSWLSVDYKAATDDLRSWVSDTLVTSISREIALSTEEQLLFRRALTEHKIEHPVSHEIKDQKRGQLMGSIVSFPLLCLANAAVCRYAFELAYGVRVLLKDCPLLINGDDAVIRISPLGRIIWSTLAGMMGFAPSLGKVYYSSKFLNINSTTFNYYHTGFVSDLETRKLRRFEKVKTVNLGLMYGIKRSGGQVSVIDDGDMSLGARAKALIDDAPSGVGEYLMKRYIKENHDALTRVPGIPWFIPENLGGIGLPPVGRFSPDRIYLRLARKIHDHPSKYRFPSKPNGTGWRLWKYALGRFSWTSMNLSKNLRFLGTDNSSVIGARSSVDDIRNLFCLEALFRSDVQLFVDPENLSEKEKEEFGASNMNFWRTKARVWLKALHDEKVPMPEPYRIDNFPANTVDIAKLAIIPTFYGGNELMGGSEGRALVASSPMNVKSRFVMTEVKGRFRKVTSGFYPSVGNND